MTSEGTDAGEQALVGGVEPVTVRDRLRCLAAARLLPRRAQKPCNLGLFDTDARNQLDFFIHAQRKETDHDADS